MQSLVSAASQTACEAPGPAVVRDWVAVSFAGDDVAWGDWLYREFDGERFPRSLLGRPSRDGMPYPERISVVPDPSDAHSPAELSALIQNAQHLILVISPSSGRDPLIGEHMRLFKAAGGEQRIIALVVNGEPASPAAKSGSEADRAWLPKWLVWRFEGNRLQTAGLEEPVVVDARLGVSSLAEVRMQILAAILEVSQAEFSSLGIVSRPTTNAKDLPAPSTAVSAQISAVVPVPRMTLPREEAASRSSKWPLAFCGIGVIAALGFLGFAPVAESTHSSRPVFRVPAAAPEPAPALDSPLITVVTMAADPLPEIAPPPPVAPARPAPKPGERQGGVTSITASLDPVEREQREIAILSAKRDRLHGLAESKLDAGNSEEAMEMFRQAIIPARQIVEQSKGEPEGTIQLATLQRRVAHLAMNLASGAEARKAYEEGRQLLVGLRSRRALPQNGERLLREIETGLRAIPRD